MKMHSLRLDKYVCLGRGVGLKLEELDPPGAVQQIICG